MLKTSSGKRGEAMKSMLKKSTLREIKQSFGRFIAIFSIIVLGVGFYSGLTITTKAMLITTKQYLNQQTFFDYRLLSTLGFTVEDIENISKQKDVKAAEGTYSIDALFVNNKGNEQVLKMHSIPERINTIMLKSGRLPENAQECVVDDNLFDEQDIGTYLTISDGNDEDTLKQINGERFKIVGLVQSPYYMNFERGTTILGNGKLAGFIYVPKSAFDIEAFTEAFVAFDQDTELYSKEYDHYMEQKEEEWERLLEERAKLRFSSIKADAQKEVDQAKDKLIKEKEKAEVKLKDASEDLNQAETQMKDGQAHIQAGRELLIQKEQEIASAENMYQIVLVEERKQLELNRAELDRKEKELADAREEWEEGKLEYKESKLEFEQNIADAESELNVAQKDIDDLEEPDIYLLGRDTNIGYTCFESDSSIVKGIAKVFPIFFFLVAALVCITTMNRMVEEQRTQIGVLKALGYSNISIMGKYLFYSGSAAVLGCLLGFFIGTYAFPRVIWTAYGIMYHLVPLKYIFAGDLLILSIGVSLICSMGTTWLSCRYELSEVAAQLMRPKAPKSGKRVMLEKIPFVWRKLKFLQKVTVRNIFRYKKRFIMMVIGIGGCTALLLTGFGIKDSISNIADFQYEEIMLYDADVNFSEDIEMFNPLKERKNIDYLYNSQQSMDIYKEGVTKSTNLVVIKEPEKISDFIDFHNKNHQNVNFPQNGETIINTKLAEVFEIKIGDDLVLYDPQFKEIHSKVSGIFDNYIYNYVFVNEETYIDQMGEKPKYKSAYVKFDDNYNVHEESAELAKLNHVTSVIVNEDMKERIKNMMSSLDYIVVTIIICAGLLAFIVLYNLTNINITERIREIATVKVLGFNQRETSQYVFRENTILTSIGIVIGLLFGKLLHAFVMKQINIDMITFDVRICWASYVWSIVLTFFFVWIVNRFMSCKIRNINMAESLKSVD